MNVSRVIGFLPTLKVAFVGFSVRGCLLAKLSSLRMFHDLELG